MSDGKRVGISWVWMRALWASRTVAIRSAVSKSVSEQVRRDGKTSSGLSSISRRVLRIMARR